MKLISSYSLYYQISVNKPELMDLKPLISSWSGRRIRRIDRYIELCLAGGLNCVAGRTLASDTGVYLATRCGAVATSARVMETIFVLQELPKPINFVNSLGNTACFYLTQLLQITGNSLVISQEHLSFEAALLHAWLDLQAGRISCALVGGIDEVTLPLAHQGQRLAAVDANAFSEGSHWLLLSRDTGVGVTFSAPEYLADMDSLLTYLENFPEAHLQCSFQPSTKEQAQLRTRVPHLSTFTQDAVSHGVVNGAALTHLGSLVTDSGGVAIHLAHTDTGGYCILSIDNTKR